MKPPTDAVLPVPYWILKVKKTKHLACADEFGEPLHEALCGASVIDRHTTAARSRCVVGDECQKCLRAVNYKGTITTPKRTGAPEMDWIKAYTILMKAIVDIVPSVEDRAKIVSDWMEVRKGQRASSN